MAAGMVIRFTYDRPLFALLNWHKALIPLPCSMMLLIIPSWIMGSGRVLDGFWTGFVVVFCTLLVPCLTEFPTKFRPFRVYPPGRIWNVERFHLVNLDTALLA